MSGLLGPYASESVAISVDPRAFTRVPTDPLLDCEIWANIEDDEKTIVKLYLEVEIVSGTLRAKTRPRSNLNILDWCTYHDPAYCHFGTCNNATHNCDCGANYYGPTCDVYCLANTTCSDQGSCGIGGDCICTDNWYGEVCRVIIAIDLKKQI
jgi:hypothetical protein